VTLNISGTQSNAAKLRSARSRKLRRDLVEEMTAWNPREFIAMFRRMKHGTISLIHLNVLTVLEMDGPQPMGRLAEALDVSVASMTGIVDRMEKRGLVERHHDSEDRRVVLVQSTDAARRVFTEIGETRRSGLSKMLEQLTDQEVEGLLKGHRALRNVRRAMADAASRLTESERAADESPAGERPATARTRARGAKP
jgi:DNA-binding MarR family transcriptional regulator